MPRTVSMGAKTPVRRAHVRDATAPKKPAAATKKPAAAKSTPKPTKQTAQTPPKAAPSPEKRTMAETRRLKKVFASLDANKLQVAQALIANAARLTIALEDAWADYHSAECGYLEEYHNGGGQSGVKQSVTMTTINTLTKHFTTIMRQLTDLAPPASKGADTLELIMKQSR